MTPRLSCLRTREEKVPGEESESQSQSQAVQCSSTILEQRRRPRRRRPRQQQPEVRGGESRPTTAPYYVYVLRKMQSHVNFARMRACHAACEMLLWH